MKILLVNKFHYIKGGSETYYFGLGELLKQKGHQVIYFSMKDKQNIPDENEALFVENMDFNQKMNLFQIVRSSGKLLYSMEARSKFKKYIQKEKPDIIHLNIFQSQLTASIVDVAYQEGIPIVYTAHDLKSICPNYQMLNRGKICEKCLKGNYFPCFLTACMKDSRSKSLLATLERYVYCFRKTYEKMDLIITPSAFYKKKLLEAGITKAPVIHMPNFLPKDTKYHAHPNGDYFLYFGRLSREKGIMTLIKAYSETERKLPLYIVGRGPLEQEIQALIRQKKLEKDVLLLGFKTGKELKDIVENARCVCLISEWYENGPYSIMEAMAAGKPVIVSDQGGLPEMVENGKTGYIVPLGNRKCLKEALEKMQMKENADKCSKNAVLKAKAMYDSEVYVSKLIQYYNILKNRSS